MHSLFQQASSLTEEVIAAAVRVQKHFGIGALESIYVRCLERELELAGHRTSRARCPTIVRMGLVISALIFLVESKICFHAGDFVARRGAVAPICRRPASLS